MRSPLGDVTSYVYDSNGRLGSIGSAAGAFTFTYDTLGRRSGLSYPNGVKATYTYDNVGRLTGLYNTTSTGITFAKNEYTFDNVGNRVTNTNEARTAAYSYDDNYRLTSANYSTTGWSGVESAIKGKTGSGKNAAKTANATAIGNQTEHYTYDPLGNRLTAEKNRTYEYNAANQLVRDKDATYVYDRNGNLISKSSSTGTTRYGYDFENRLVSVTNPDGTRVEFKYDVFGRRIEKKTVIASGSEAISSGSAEVTRYFYDGEDILFEYDGSGNVGNRYTHGPGIDEPLALTTDKGVYFYHADGLGSIVALTDKDQTVVQDYQYGFFGDLKDLKNRIKQPYTYTAREYDRETGLYFYRARYYDAEAGRFITKDPIGFRGGMNMYAYVGGNPVNFIDPWGEEAVPPIFVPAPPPAPVPAPAPPAPAPQPASARVGNLYVVAIVVGTYVTYKLYELGKDNATESVAHDGKDPYYKTSSARKETSFYWEEPDYCSSTESGKSGDGGGYDSCQKLYLLCVNGKMTGDCGMCLRNCLAQDYIWPFRMCPWKY